MSDKEVRNNKAKRRISISKIIESYKNGMTYKQIGAEFEVSENAIRNRIVEYEKKTGEKIRRTRTSSKNQNPGPAGRTRRCAGPPHRPECLPARCRPHGSPCR